MIYDNDEREDLTLRKEMGLLSLHLMKLNDEVKYDEGDLYESPRNNVYGLLEDVYDTEDELLEEFKEFRNDTYGMLSRGNVDRPDIDIYDPILGFMQQYKIENDDREKQKRRSLEYHFDNVVGAISDEDGKREISLFEKFRRFQRDFLWTLGRTLGDAIKGSLKGALNLTGRGLFGIEGIGNLIGFGRDNRSIQEKILDAINQQTEFFLTGKIDQSKSLVQRLNQYGLLGTAVRGTRDAAMRIVGVDRNRAQTNIIDSASGVERDYSHLGRSERILEKIKDSLSGKLYGSTSTLYGRMSPVEKSKEDILDEVKFSNIILKNISKQIDPINRTATLLLKEAYGISDNIIANTNNSLLEYNRSSLVEKARYEDSMEFWEETRGDLINVVDNTKRTAKEVEKHRKQAFFQRMMGMVGNILKGIGSLAGAIASALGLKRILGRGVSGVGGPVGGPKADPKSGGRLKYVMGTIAAVGAALAKGGIGKVISKGSDLAKSAGSSISKGIRDKGLKGYTEGIVSGGRRLAEDGAISTIMKKSPMTKKVVEDGLINSMKDKSFRDMTKATATTAALGGMNVISGMATTIRNTISKRNVDKVKPTPSQVNPEEMTKTPNNRKFGKTKAIIGGVGTLGLGTAASIALDKTIENTEEDSKIGGIARVAGKGVETSIMGGLLGAITGAIIGGVTGGGFGAIPGAAAGWKAGSLGGAIGGTGLGLYEHRDAIFGNKTPIDEPKNVPENVSPIISPHHTRNPTDIDGSGKIKEANNNGDIWASPFKKEEAPDERFSSLKAIQESIALPFDHIKDMYDKLTKTTDDTSETLKEGNDIAKEMAKTLREMAEKMDQVEDNPMFGMMDPSLGAFE